MNKYFIIAENYNGNELLVEAFINKYQEINKDEILFIDNQALSTMSDRDDVSNQHDDRILVVDFSSETFPLYDCNEAIDKWTIKKIKSVRLKTNNGKYTNILFVCDRYNLSYFYHKVISSFCQGARYDIVDNLPQIMMKIKFRSFLIYVYQAFFFARFAYKVLRKIKVGGRLALKVVKYFLHR